MNTIFIFFSLFFSSALAMENCNIDLNQRIESISRTEDGKGICPECGEKFASFYTGPERNKKHRQNILTHLYICRQSNLQSQIGVHPKKKKQPLQVSRIPELRPREEPNLGENRELSEPGTLEIITNAHGILRGYYCSQCERTIRAWNQSHISRDCEKHEQDEIEQNERIPSLVIREFTNSRLEKYK